MYRTELMDEILTSPMAQKIIQLVSPIYGEAYTVLWLYQAIGTILDKMDEWTGSLQDQVLPQTATWSIPYWEEQYGIVSDPRLSTEQRRINILQRCRNKSQINPKRMEDILKSISGFSTEITENVAKNTFMVTIHGHIEDLTHVKEAIREMKPAHLIYQIVIADLIMLDCVTHNAVIVTERETHRIDVARSENTYIAEIYDNTTLSDDGRVIIDVNDDMASYMDARYNINTDSGMLTVENGTYSQFRVDDNGHLYLEVK